MTIDHVSVGVRSLERAAAFYETLLNEIGFERLVDKAGTVGFGKRYAEFWLNERPALEPATEDRGVHVCLRARSQDQVDAFYDRALALGAEDAGKPGLREIYANNYYAAFVRDADRNVLEVVTFLEPADHDASSG